MLRLTYSQFMEILRPEGYGIMTTTVVGADGEANKVTEAKVHDVFCDYCGDIVPPVDAEGKESTVVVNDGFTKAYDKACGERWA